jgi:hypothetical protein
MTQLPKGSSIEKSQLFDLFYRQYLEKPTLFLQLSLEAPEIKENQKILQIRVLKVKH